MGQPVAGNPTQYMMEKAFARAGLDWRYLTLEIAPEDLGDAMRGMRAMGFRGANFMTPHQVAVIEHLDELSDAARLVGTVDCASRQGDRLVGENTDGKGFLEALGQVSDAKDRRVVIFGAGGAARAIAVELALAGAAEITIASHTEEQSAELMALLASGPQVPAKLIVPEGDYAVPEDAEVIVNATSESSGDAAASLSIDVATLREELIVADLAVNPPQSRLLCEAAEHGCQTLDGLAILVNQAVVGFKIWTGVEPDAGVMRDALEEFFGL